MKNVVTVVEVYNDASFSIKKLVGNKLHVFLSGCINIDCKSLIIELVSFNCLTIFFGILGEGWHTC